VTLHALGRVHTKWANVTELFCHMYARYLCKKKWVCLKHCGKVNVIKLGWTWFSLCIISLDLNQFVYHQPGLDSLCVSSAWTWFSLCIINLDLIQFVYYQPGLDSVCVSSSWTWFSWCVINVNLFQFVDHQHKSDFALGELVYFTFSRIF
jgi:hypothetical protein